MVARLRQGDIGSFAAVFAIVLISLPFALYAVDRGLALSRPEEQLASRLFQSGSPWTNVAIYGHMIAGGVVTALAPLQLLSFVRWRWPSLHRASGYVIAGLTTMTATGGLFYIAVKGTVGGAVMDLGFGFYGALMLLSVVRTVQLAQKRDPRHRLWAERLVILALASWLYRVHYGVWELLTQGAGSRPDFSGPFDIVQVFAFYLPYVLVHAWFWPRRLAARARLT